MKNSLFHVMLKYIDGSIRLHKVASSSTQDVAEYIKRNNHDSRIMSFVILEEEIVAKNEDVLDNIQGIKE